MIRAKISQTNSGPIHSESSSSSSFDLQNYEIYTKFADSDIIAIDNSATFQYVPSLSQTFTVEQPTLFKTTVQGGIYNEGRIIRTIVQVIVNDHVVVGDTLIPNTADTMNNRLQASGGYFVSNSQNVAIVVPFTRISYVYLQPGTYTFNVGMRCFKGLSKFEVGMVTYELIQYKNSSLRKIGGLRLNTIAN
ncbi:unnamed protein product [Adineta steineri]|nr:unnamed protein product [Adineta steineri]